MTKEDQGPPARDPDPGEVITKAPAPGTDDPGEPITRTPPGEDPGEPR
jgi:hypothetical protein